MGRIDITMPQLGETLSEGTISVWLKAVGDTVTTGETVLEVSTDKVDTEIVSPADGVLTGPLTPEGETVLVGAVIAGISSVVSTDVPVTVPPSVPSAEPAARSAEPAVPSAGTPLTRHRTQIREAGPPTGRALLSPRVRRLVTDHGIELAWIQGTGADGRITARDVDSHLDAARSARPAVPEYAGPAEPVAARPATSPATTKTIPPGATPMSRVRRITAERTLESLRTSAHVLSVVEVDYANVDRVRDLIKARWKEENGFSLTYLPFICRAVIDTLREFPGLNASVVGDAIVHHGSVDLGLAVDLGERGLVVPVIKRAHDRRMAAVARDISTLAERARTGALTADESAPGTFTITNNGSAGSVLTAPIIVQPQVAILSTDAIVRRVVPIPTDDGELLAVHNVGNLALSWDHRAMDGAYAARFLTAVKNVLERRDWNTEL
ncbi:MAG: dihydrolipoamide acyltransferase [Pseudonocardiales bacterium]|nr:dihydrolipoamide acyltransferase [Pseudonocardiales bacterium]